MIPLAGLLALAVLQSPDSVVAEARRIAATLADTGAARREGFGPLALRGATDLTPFQGQHWLHRWRVAGGSPDLASPSFVMFAPVKGAWKQAGLAYSRRIGPDSLVPTALGGVETPWHLHQPCAFVPGEGDVLADGEDDCKARGGYPRPPEIAMVHVWTIANPEGPFAHDNVALPYWVTGLPLPTAADLSTPGRARRTRALGLALGESYGARLPYARLIEHLAARPGLGDSLAVHRERLAGLVTALGEAERARNRARVKALSDRAIAEWEALERLYAASAPTAVLRTQLEHERDRALGAGSHHHGH